MLTYWKDDKESPAALRSSKKRRQFPLENWRQIELNKLHQKELQQGIIIPIPFDQVAYLSPVFLVDKKMQPGQPPKFRKVVDYRQVNEQQTSIHFRMEGPETVQKTMLPFDWLTSIDLESAFHHLFVNPAMQPFLAFEHDQSFYTYRAMPFGAKHSPRLFTEALGYAIAYIRANWDVRIVAYMDDILLMHQDPKQLELATWQIAAYLRYLGWTLSNDKCEFTPSQKIRFLGWWWDTTSLTLQMTPEMRSALTSEVKRTTKIAETNGRMTSKALASLIGSLNFLRAQLPRASLYLRTLHRALAEMVNLAGWTGSHTLPRRVLSELQFWQRSIGWNTPFCFAPRPSQGLLTTDASEDAWAAHIVIGDLSQHTSGPFFPSDRLTSSNQRETAAVLRGLSFFKAALQTYKIRALTIQSDNTVTVYNLQRQGAGPALLELTRAIFSLLLEIGTRITARHIPGVENVLADTLSRLETTGDYSLRDELFRMGTTALQVKPTFDAFANRNNTKLPRFAALPGPDATGAAQIDAMEAGPGCIKWSAELMYIFPPVGMIDQVLRKLTDEAVTAVLVLPQWPRQPWWGLFRPMAKAIVELGKTESALIPGPLMTKSKTEKKLPPGLWLMALVGPPTPLPRPTTTRSDSSS
jgi:hypothetical protein